MAIYPQFTVRLVYYFREQTYALHFELHKACKEPGYPRLMNFNNISLGYDHRKSQLLVMGDTEPLNTTIRARVIYEFTQTVLFQYVPFVHLNSSPRSDEHYISSFHAEYDYEDLYQECEEIGQLGNVFLGALMSAYLGTQGGQRTSWAVMMYMLEILTLQNQLLPINELQEAKDRLFSLA